MHHILKNHIETGHFSQGYLLAGDLGDAKKTARETAALILNCDEKLLDSHPDFFEQSFDLFSIDDSGNIIRKISAKSILAPKRVFLLEVSRMSFDAAANLSQILEKFFLICHIFLITPFAEEIPPVLRLKMTIISEEKLKLTDERKIFWQEFLKSGAMERLELSKIAASDKKQALEFLNELEAVLHEEVIKNARQPLSAKVISFLDDLKSARQFLFDRATLPKMIIEHFALTAPKF